MIDGNAVVMYQATWNDGFYLLTGPLPSPFSFSAFSYAWEFFLHFALGANTGVFLGV